MKLLHSIAAGLTLVLTTSSAYGNSTYVKDHGLVLESSYSKSKPKDDATPSINMAASYPTGVSAN